MTARRAPRRTSRHLGRRVFATLVGALALAASPTLSSTLSSTAVAAPAGSAPSAVTVTGDLNPALIDPDALGRLTIHVHLAAVSSARPTYSIDGSSTPTTPPQAGVIFTVSRVDGVDLTTAAGWELARSYRESPARAVAALGATVTSAPTDSEGISRVGDLPVGLYLVRQSGVSRPAGPVDTAVTRAADFLVTIPMTHPTTGSSWLYDLDVYSKLTRLSIAKRVADGNEGVVTQDAPHRDSRLTYYLVADVPADGLRAFGGACRAAAATATGPGLDGHGFTSEGFCPPGATYVGVAAGAAYAITDDLRQSVVPGTERRTSDYLALRTPDWIGAVRVFVDGGSPQQLQVCAEAAANGCHYVLEHDAVRLRVSMTDLGLRTLAAAKASVPSTTVRVEFEAAVLEAISDPRDPAYATSARVLRLPNLAQLRVGTLDDSALLVLTSNIVETVYATLSLHKVDQDTGAGLPGAVFTIYRTRADALARRAPIAVTAPTDASGMAYLAGLHVSDFQNNDSDTDRYWVVETTVPVGYVGRTEPFEVRVLRDGRTDPADSTGGFRVPNPRADSSRPGPGPGPLARTGLDALVEIALALLLVGGGVVLVILGRRRDHREEPA